MFSIPSVIWKDSTCSSVKDFCGSFAAICSGKGCSKPRRLPLPGSSRRRFGMESLYRPSNAIANTWQSTLRDMKLSEGFIKCSISISAELISPFSIHRHIALEWCRFGQIAPVGLMLPFCCKICNLLLSWPIAVWMRLLDSLLASSISWILSGCVAMNSL